MMLMEAYGLMKTGKTESESPGIVPEPELRLEADEVEESVDMAQDQSMAPRSWEAAHLGDGAT